MQRFIDIGGEPSGFNSRTLGMLRRRTCGDQWWTRCLELLCDHAGFYPPFGMSANCMLTTWLHAGFGSSTPRYFSVACPSQCVVTSLTCFDIVQCSVIVSTAPFLARDSRWTTASEKTSFEGTLSLALPAAVCRPWMFCVLSSSMI